MENKKHILDFKVVQNLHLGENYALLKLTPVEGEVPPSAPGQFAQVLVPNSKNTFLRRPISICNIDYDENLLWLLVRRAGEGTAALCDLHEGDSLNVMFPLGHGFTLHRDGDMLLVGGGVGVAPLLMLGKVLKEQGIQPQFLLGARTQADLLLRRLGWRSRRGYQASRAHQWQHCSYCLLRPHAHDACGGSTGSPARHRLRSVARESHGLRHGSLPVLC